MGIHTEKNRASQPVDLDNRVAAFGSATSHKLDAYDGWMFDLEHLVECHSTSTYFNYLKTSRSKTCDRQLWHPVWFEASCNCSVSAANLITCSSNWLINAESKPEMRCGMRWKTVENSIISLENHGIILRYIEILLKIRDDCGRIWENQKEPFLWGPWPMDVKRSHPAHTSGRSHGIFQLRSVPRLASGWKKTCFNMFQLIPIPIFLNFSCLSENGWSPVVTCRHHRFQTWLTQGIFHCGMIWAPF